MTTAGRTVCKQGMARAIRVPLRTCIRGQTRSPPVPRTAVGHDLGNEQVTVRALRSASQSDNAGSIPVTGSTVTRSTALSTGSAQGSSVRRRPVLPSVRLYRDVGSQLMVDRIFGPFLFT